jgi:hypothetical protein
MDAVGALCYLIGKPENWNVSATELGKRFRCGRRRVDRVMRELRDAGYADLKRGGADGGAGWVVYDRAIGSQGKAPKISLLTEAIAAKRDNRETRQSRNATIAKRDNRVLHNIVNTDLRLNTEEGVNTDGAQSASRCVTASPRAAKTSPRTTFTPPSVEDVRAYCRERGNRVDPESFVDHYTAKGWMIGKNGMKDWKAAVRTWERRSTSSSSQYQDHPFAMGGTPYV